MSKCVWAHWLALPSGCPCHDLVRVCSSPDLVSPADVGARPHHGHEGCRPQDHGGGVSEEEEEEDEEEDNTKKMVEGARNRRRSRQRTPLSGLAHDGLFLGYRLLAGQIGKIFDSVW
jgi:hypothetical protein